MNSPSVTVIMAAYNAEATIDAALQSLAEQTYESWSLVICDDASTDSTYARIVEFAQRHPGQVTVLRHKTNQHLAASLNSCLSHVSADLIARMDSDDISVPARLEKQVEFLIANPEVHLVGSSVQRFSDDGMKDLLTFRSRPDRYSLKKGVPYAHASIMARTEVYRSLGGYTVSNRTRRSQDLDLWFRFYAAGLQGANLPEPLYLVREDMQAIRRRSARVRLNAWRIRVYGFRLLRYPLHWYLWPTLELVKVVVPAWAVAAYRRWELFRQRHMIARGSGGQ